MDYRPDLVYNCQEGGRAAKTLHEHRHNGGHQPLRGAVGYTHCQPRFPLGLPPSHLLVGAPGSTAARKTSSTT
jgi:hypothetical protein